MAQDDFIYGRHPVGEALRSGSRPIQKLIVAEGASLGDLLELAKQRNIPIQKVGRGRLDSMVGGAQHQGVVATVPAFAYSDIDDVIEAVMERGETPLILACDQIQDPHNLGSLARSALALGAHAIVFPKDRAVEVTGTVVKTSAGATAHLPMCRVTNLRTTLDSLKERGLWVYGAAADEGSAIADTDFARPCVVVIGSEGSGMRRLTAETCDALMHVPMSGKLGSLNAAVAGGIVLYEAARQRREKP
jgi:23S rRNA (guanosine2251-2'-O)-methyltransferase